MKVLSINIIYIFLLGGISALDELQFNTREQIHLSKQLFKQITGIFCSVYWGACALSC